ncbi:MAG TPA: acyltransferase, partial [Microthrixaceae bacterium]|nr:acyltransferase [Microthrixaceae bacterium]
MPRPVSPVVDRRARIAGFDGLRALAVTAVVLTHARVNRGGWIGVDTFFVLSGFLIASLLMSDLGRGRPMREFWFRRARRLLPAFLLMIMIVCGLMLLEVVEVVGPPGQPFSQAFWSVLYVGNWYEVVAGSDYWTQFGQSPFGHLWSLGIEEQFYLLFPLIMWAAWRARRVSGLAVLAVITVASGAWALYLGL